MRIFIVEDDLWYQKLIQHTLSLDPDYEVHIFETGKACVSNLHLQPDCITLDYNLPDAKGTEVLKSILDYNPSIGVIIISEQDKIDTAVELLKAGAFDYVEKSANLNDRLFSSIRKLQETQKLQKEVVSLRAEVGEKYDWKHKDSIDCPIIGESEAIKQVCDLVKKACKTDITVSVTGETGTGKEVVSKAIHYNSKRKEEPFVPINMAAIPKELIESELFGHEKGAFTGASTRRIGKFEEAHGGTLFLDEIGELDIAIQAKLLRVLQEQEFNRIGSNTAIKTDCRIIVATHRNLAKEVKEGRFRQDLFYRLYGLPIQIPALRERDNDILILAQLFAERFAIDNEMSAPTLSKVAQQKLKSYPFPGNVRELKSVMELAMVMSGSGLIEGDDILLQEGDNVLPDILTEELTLKMYEHQIVKLYLKRYNGDVKIVADKLDIGKSTIYRMIKEMENKV